jgi:hypothetical protein
MRSFVLLVLCAAFPEAAGAEDLSWMAGCWSGQKGTTVFEELWTRPAGGLQLGIARTIRQGKVVFHEFMRVENKSGALTFTPRIGSLEKPVVFTSIRQTSDEVVFENAAHDFPQRVIYRKTAEGLLGRIEGMVKGTLRAEEFPMKRAACE